MLRSAWVSVQRWPWPLRWAAKVVFVAVVTFLVLYPRPGLFVRHLRHYARLNELADPNCPALAPWAAEVAARMPADATARQRMRIVEEFVRRKVPYAHDWETWAVCDYLPTIPEIIRAGREDCDGRALIAAALLRPYEADAHLVTDGRHVWVAAASGECMSPGGPKAFEAAPGGRRTNLRALASIRNPAYAVAVFPLSRELIIAAAVWLALADPRMRIRHAAGAALLLLQGMLVIRLAARNPWDPTMWGIWLGFAEMAAAVAILVVMSRRARRTA